MNIVIPSYEKHLSYNLNFLESFRKYCNDKQRVIINFICCNSNQNEFFQLKEKFKDLNINIFTLSQLIKKVDGIDFDDSPCNFITKYSLQSLKKLLSYSIVDSDYLAIDSENLCVKDFYFQDIIDSMKMKKINKKVPQHISNRCAHCSWHLYRHRHRSAAWPAIWQRGSYQCLWLAPPGLDDDVE